MVFTETPFRLTPTPNPSPQGGGEPAVCVALCRIKLNRRSSKHQILHQAYFLLERTRAPALARGELHRIDDLRIGGAAAEIA